PQLLPTSPHGRPERFRQLRRRGAGRGLWRRRRHQRRGEQGAPGVGRVLHRHGRRACPLRAGEDDPADPGDVHSQVKATGAYFPHAPVLNLAIASATNATIPCSTSGERTNAGCPDAAGRVVESASREIAFEAMGVPFAVTSKYCWRNGGSIFFVCSNVKSAG